MSLQLDRTTHSLPPVSVSGIGIRSADGTSEDVVLRVVASQISSVLRESKMNRRDRRQSCVAGFVALAMVLVFAGCSSRVATTYEIEESRQESAPDTKYVIVAEAAKSKRALRVGMQKQVTRDVTVKRILKKITTSYEKDLEWQPGFFALPLAPLQCVGGLTGTMGLATGYGITYPIRGVVGSTAGTLCAVTGATTYTVQVVSGLTGNVLALVFNPAVKDTMAVVFIVAESVSLIPAVIDGLFDSQASRKYILETLMLPFNLDILLLGRLTFQDADDDSSPYIPYSKVTTSGFIRAVNRSWEQTLSDTWYRTWANSWLLDSFGTATVESFQWGWDWEQPALQWGITRSDDRRQQGTILGDKLAVAKLKAAKAQSKVDETMGMLDGQWGAPAPAPGKAQELVRRLKSAEREERQEGEKARLLKRSLTSYRSPIKKCWDFAWDFSHYCELPVKDTGPEREIKRDVEEKRLGKPVTEHVVDKEACRSGRGGRAA